MSSSHFSYAKAIGHDCTTLNDQKKWLLFLENLVVMIGNKDFNRFYFDPQIALDNKIALILKVAEPDSLEKENFVKIIIKKQKTKQVKLILTALRAYFAEKNNMLNGTVLTSTPLTSEAINTLENFLEKQYKKSVFLTQKIGAVVGIKIQVENDEINYTATYLIQRLATLLKRGSIYDA
jgi:F0F1-type ATP synthase delta subunit